MSLGNAGVFTRIWANFSTDDFSYLRNAVTRNRPNSVTNCSTVYDHYTFLGNCPPTPPLGQHFLPSEK